MKSERRHELQHNELADWLIKTGAAFKPYQNIVLVVVLVVVVAMLGYTIWSRQSAAATTRAWDETSDIIDSGNVAKLAKVTEDYPNTNAGCMASLVLGDYYLGEGCNKLFVNKATAQTDLNKAIEAYQLVLDQSTVPSFQERATFGLARAKEAKALPEDLKQAQQLYSDVVSKWPQGAFAAAAQKRLNDLKRPDTKRMYDRFAKFDPKPAYSSEPGAKPVFDMNSLPSEAPVELPDTTYNLKPDDKNTGKVLTTEGAKPTGEAGKK